MSPTLKPQTAAQSAAAANASGPAAVPSIAVRKSCNPDGIGLSHYVLIDQKVAK